MYISYIYIYMYAMGLSNSNASRSWDSFKGFYMGYSKAARLLQGFSTGALASG